MKGDIESFAYSVVRPQWWFAIIIKKMLSNKTVKNTKNSIKIDGLAVAKSYRTDERSLKKNYSSASNANTICSYKDHISKLALHKIFPQQKGSCKLVQYEIMRSESWQKYNTVLIGSPGKGFNFFFKSSSNNQNRPQLSKFE